MNDWLLPVAAGSNQWQPVAVSQPLVIIFLKSRF